MLLCIILAFPLVWGFLWFPCGINVFNICNENLSFGIIRASYLFGNGEFWGGLFKILTSIMFHVSCLVRHNFNSWSRYCSHTYNVETQGIILASKWVVYCPEGSSLWAVLLKHRFLTSQHIGKI